MKLSDIRGDRTLDVIADIIPPIARIARDDQAMEIFKPKSVPDGMEPGQFFASRIEKAAPALLKGHKDDVICILATIAGVTPEEYTAGMNLASLMKDLIELMGDKEFLGFLSDSAKDMAQPTAQSETTGALFEVMS